MLHPLWLVGKIRDFKCSNCGRYPHSIISIHGQAIVPARGDRVLLSIEYGCHYCNRIVPVTTHITTEETAELLVSVVQSGSLRMTFRDPIQIYVLPPVSPSIIKGTPSEPIDAADLERASRILKRTSFRRNSRTWKRFMYRLERGY